MFRKVTMIVLWVTLAWVGRATGLEYSPGPAPTCDLETDADPSGVVDAGDSFDCWIDNWQDTDYVQCNQGYCNVSDSMGDVRWSANPFGSVLPLVGPCTQVTAGYPAHQASFSVTAEVHDSGTMGLDEPVYKYKEFTVNPVKISVQLISGAELSTTVPKTAVAEVSYDEVLLYAELDPQVPQPMWLYWTGSDAEYGSLYSTVPTDNPAQVKATAIYIGDDFTSISDYMNVIVFQATVTKLLFTSDHGVLTPYNSDFAGGDGSTPYDPRGWVQNGANNPVTHTQGQKIAATATVNVQPAGIAFDLNGDGAIPALTFQNAGLSATGGDQDVPVNSTGPLQAQIGVVNQGINWSVTVGGVTADAGSSGPHTIYVLWGSPAGATPTLKRVTFICNSANGNAGVTPCANAIYNALAGSPPTFALGNTPSNIWSMMDPGGPTGECIDLAKLMRDMCSMLGLGSGEIGFVYATTDNNCYNTSSNAQKTRVCPGGVHGSETLLYYAGGGWNNWEAIFKINGWYYAVQETSNQTPVSIIKTILGPNDPGANNKGNHQAWTYSQPVTCCVTPGPHPVPLP